MKYLFNEPYLALPLAMLLFGTVAVTFQTCSAHELQKRCLEQHGSWIDDSCRFEREEDPVDDSRED